VTRDPIVEEVRRIRDELAAKYGYDIDKIFEAARKQERKSGRKTVSFVPKPTRAVKVTKRRTAKRSTKRVAGRHERTAD
jgi:hypothetical protein